MAMSAASYVQEVVGRHIASIEAMPARVRRRATSSARAAEENFKNPEPRDQWTVLEGPRFGWTIVMPGPRPAFGAAFLLGSAERQVARPVLLSVALALSKGELEFRYHFGDRRLAGLDRQLDYLYTSPHLASRPRVQAYLLQRINASAGSMPEMSPTQSDLGPAGPLVVQLERLHHEGIGAPHTPAARLAYEAGTTGIQGPQGKIHLREPLTAIVQEYCAAMSWPIA